MSLRKAVLLFATFYSVAALFPSPGLAAHSCERLSQLKLLQTTISTAVSVPAGEFQRPDAPPSDRSSVNLPAFCRVTGVITPSADSEIKFEIWMPSQNWNGKFNGVGNGGFAGSINYGGLAAALRAGYAAASTDTGHAAGGTDARWALDHPEKIVDFAYRAIHLTAETGKAIVQNFYGDAPRWSYFSSCSNGGRQALMEAQRFPDDYNGIIAGAPANYWTHLLATAVWNMQATLESQVSYIPATKLPVISQAVLAACDAKDGVKDGILNDPRQCGFNPDTLLCKGPDSPACLTTPQVAALKRIYAGPVNKRGQKVFPGFMPGAELGPGGWALWITGTAPEKSLDFAFGTQFFSNMVFDNATWDFRKLNYDSDMLLTDQRKARILNATDPDLAKFSARGGKLILYHGWNDAAIPALNTVDYYRSVVLKMGLRKADRFVRLYMAPGVQHCGGGPGPDSFGVDPSADADPEHSMFSALERWVEHDKAPKAIIASKHADPSSPAGGPEMTRPLCPYPEEAKFKGEGDTNDAANFVCATAPNR
jgi:hypothetical protein